MKPVIVCTEHRGVFYGHTDKSAEDILRDGVVSLTGARMAIYWGTKRGVLELAEDGPNANSKISATADIAVNKITAVFMVSEKAEIAWQAA